VYGWEVLLKEGLKVTFFSGVGLSPLGTAATSGLLYKPQLIDEGDCGAIGGMKIGRGNRSTRTKPRGQGCKIICNYSCELVILLGGSST
jgi:hypothetical protein